MGTLSKNTTKKRVKGMKHTLARHDINKQNYVEKQILKRVVPGVLSTAMTAIKVAKRIKDKVGKKY